jgi:excisionase family DNA binding protein
MADQIVWLSTAQAAQRLGIGRTAVHKRIHAGRLPAVRAGARFRIREDILTEHQAKQAAR